MPLTLDVDSRSLLYRAQDGLFLGVIRIKDSTVLLFRCASKGDPATNTYPDHRTLISSKGMSSFGHLGFCIDVRNRKLHRLYRNSVLNESLPLCILSQETEEELLAALAMQLSDDFKCFP
jgi:hypothetical protein